MSESPLTALQRARASAIALAAAPVIGGLCRTLTWKVDGAEHYDAIINSGRQPILACWHGRILTGLTTSATAASSPWPARTSTGSGLRAFSNASAIRPPGAQPLGVAPALWCSCGGSCGGARGGDNR